MKILPGNFVMNQRVCFCEDQCVKLSDREDVSAVRAFYVMLAEAICWLVFSLMVTLRPDGHAEARKL